MPVLITTQIPVPLALGDAPTKSCFVLTYLQPSTSQISNKPSQHSWIGDLELDLNHARR